MQTVRHNLPIAYDFLHFVRRPPKSSVDNQVLTYSSC
jgi:hypothetical protein